MLVGLKIRDTVTLDTMTVRGSTVRYIILPYSQQMASVSILPVYILDKPTTGGVNTVVVSAKHTPVNNNDMTTVLKMLLSIIIRFLNPFEHPADMCCSITISTTKSSRG
jgi:hypothetical protein